MDLFDQLSAQNYALLFQLQSVCILALMFTGVALRRQRSKHVKLMSVAIAWDVLLILQIELSRGAIVKASKVVTNTTILNIHVTFAVLCVILYGLMIYTGRKLLKNQNHLRSRHRMLGILTLSLRLLTFITSFFTVSSTVS